jgi:FkbM family methyltransferase
VIVGLARRAGVDVRRHDPWGSLAARRQRWLLAEEIELVLDAGANSGQYGAELREHGYRGAIVSFEPGAAAYQGLERAAAADPLWRCRRVGLGERAGRLALNVASNEGASSSFLSFGEAHFASAPLVTYAGTETVDVSTLDELAGEGLFPQGRTWLKLDVQGYELHVLEGARHTLPRIHALELELSLVGLYDGQPLFDQLLRFVQEAGFRTVDVAPEFVDPRTGRMLQVNLLAIRPDA